MATFGTVTVGSVLDELSNGKAGGRYTLSTAATITDVQVYLAKTIANSTTETQPFKAVIYRQSDGVLLATSNELTLGAADSTGWKTFTFGTNPALAAVDHWLMVHAGAVTLAGSMRWSIAYETSGGTFFFNTDAYNDGPETPLGTNATGGPNRKLSIYADYPTVVKNLTITGQPTYNGDGTTRIDSGGTQVMGYNSVGAVLDQVDGNLKAGSRFTLASPQTVNNVSVYLTKNIAGTGTQKFKALIYNSAGALQATSTTELTLTNTDGAGWKSFAFTPIALAAGDYWLMVFVDVVTSSGTMRWSEAYESSGGSFFFNTDTYSDGPSDPMGTNATGGTTRKMSIYATAGAGGNDRVQAPADRLDKTQSWAAMRIKWGFAATSGGTGRFMLAQWRIDANNLIELFYDHATNKYVTRRKSAGAGSDHSFPATATVFAIGDTHTIVFAWTSTNSRGAFNGAVFTQTANSSIPAGTAPTFLDIGSDQGTQSWINSDVVWFATGSGALTDGDSSSLHALGNNSAVAFANLPDTPTMIWNADDATYLDSDTGGNTGGGLTIGKTAAGASFNLVGANIKQVGKAPLTEYGDISKVVARVRNLGASPQVLRPVIYADAGGTPGALLGTGPEVTLAAGAALAWKDFPLSSIVRSSPTTLWIGLWSGATANMAEIAYDTDTSGPNRYNSNTYAATGNPSDPFGTITDTSANNFGSSIYAAYTQFTPTPAGSTFGNTGVGGTTGALMNADTKFASRSTAPEAGTATSISINMENAGNEIQTFRVGLYGDTTGSPSSLLGISADYAIAPGMLRQWLTFPLTSTVSMASGQAFWITIHAGSTGGQCRYFYDTGAANTYATNSDAWGDGATNAFGTATLGTQNIAAYVTYTPGTVVIPGFSRRVRRRHASTVS